MRQTNVMLLFGLLTVLVACSGGENSTPGASVSSVDSASGHVFGLDSQRGDSSGHSRISTEVLGVGDKMLSLIEEERIDGSVTDLWSISWLGVGADSSLVLAHAKNYHLAQVSSSGIPLGAVGRKGSGPGEFRRLSRAGWLGDTLWVSDTDLRRVTFISAALRVTSTLPVKPVSIPRDTRLPLFRNYAAVTPLAMLGGNDLLVLVEPSMMEAFRSPELLRAAILRVSRDGAFRAFITALPPSERYTLIRTSTGGAVGINPFGWESIWDVAPTGDYVAKVQRDAGSDSIFHVLSLSATGDTVAFRRFTVQPQRASRQDADRIWNAQISGGRHKQEVLNYYDSVERGDVYPSETAVCVGRDGSVWIRLRPYGGIENPWLALASTGETRGIVNVPDNAKIVVAHGAMVWASTVDEDGFVSVTRYRVMPADTLSF